MNKRASALLAATAMVLCLAVGCGPKQEKPKPTLPKPADEGYETATLLDAVKFGIDNSGQIDATEQMIALHAESAEKHKPVYYANGMYRFNGKTLDFSGGVQFESPTGVCIRNNCGSNPIVNFDDNGNLIGLMQNHLEKTFTGSTVDDTLTGNLVSPPLSTADYTTRVDVLPYWFNEFGLTATLNDGAAWNGWYDWRWNHHDCVEKQGGTIGFDDYDPTRHPLLGWYRGDDPVVLDWICYWLQEYGMKQAMLLGNITSTWEEKTDRNHWIYQLLNHVPNAKQMRFGFWVSSTRYNVTAEQLEASWKTLFDAFHFNEEYKDRVYAITKDKKDYPCLFIWDEKAVASGVGDSEELAAFYKRIADLFIEKGYGGVCIMARNTLTGGLDWQAELAAQKVLWYRCGYSEGGGVIDRPTYKERVNSFIPYSDATFMYGVATGHKSHTPHTSGWSESGYNPTDFGRWLKAILDAVDALPDAVRTVTCYNVSEWAEGGPGLVPTVADRFAYLEAIRNAIVVENDN